MWQECFSYGKLIHPIVPKVNLTIDIIDYVNGIGNRSREP